MHPSNWLSLVLCFSLLAWKTCTDKKIIFISKGKNSCQVTWGEKTGFFSLILN